MRNDGENRIMLSGGVIVGLPGVRLGNEKQPVFVSVATCGIVCCPD